MTDDCEAMRAALKECVSALLWDHFYDPDGGCDNCVALAHACDALGIPKEKAEI